MRRPTNRKNPEAKKFGDGEVLGFINRMQIQEEGGWTRLCYPRSQWLTGQLAGDEDHGGVETGTASTSGSLGVVTNGTKEEVRHQTSAQEEEQEQPVRLP